MWPFKSTARGPTYQPVRKIEDDEDQDSFELEQRPQDGLTTSTEPDEHRKRRRRLLLLLPALILATGLLLGGARYFQHLRLSRPSSYGPSSPQSSPASNDASTSILKRREWRTLTPTEQKHYITSVLCLTSQPSSILKIPNGTLYDDWPWMHAHVGYYTHHAAPFLPWHRYFLHLYQQKLRDVCDYQGALVYWDWTVDADAGALEEAPVFATDWDGSDNDFMGGHVGFGGDGEVGGEITVGKTGRCVKSGPFKDITAKYYDVKTQPHCLSRGFRTDEGKLGHIDGSVITSASIGQTLALQRYEDFVREMEKKVHDAIPFGIGGDFETFSAPYDPLFFLHHVQLDRLWWLWQQQSKAGSESNEGEEEGKDRTFEYNGRPTGRTMEKAQLTDRLKMGPLAGDIEVKDVMDTKAGCSDGKGMLCYTY